jgi:hypothetical protein
MINHACALINRAAGKWGVVARNGADLNVSFARRFFGVRGKKCGSAGRRERPAGLNTNPERRAYACH